MALTNESPQTRLLKTSEAVTRTRRRWRRYIPALVVLAAMCLGGLYLGIARPGGERGRPPPASGSTAESSGSTAPTAPARTEPTPTAERSSQARANALGSNATRIAAGIPVGYPKTRAGAQSAAVNYAVAYGSADMFVAERRRQIVGAIVERSRREDLLRQLDQAFTAVARGYQLDESGRPPNGLTFVSRTAPIGVRLVEYGGGRATVEVWTTGIVGLAGEGSPMPVTEAWSTSTVRLEWHDRDWKWVSFVQRDGPVPMSGMQPPSGPDEVVAGVQGFSELQYAR